MHISELHNAKETKEILEKGSSNVFFKWYHKKKKGPHPGGKPVKKSKLDRIEESIANLTNLTMQMNDRFDNLEKDVSSLKQDVKGLKQDVKDINARLDYNGLKRLPESDK